MEAKKIKKIQNEQRRCGASFQKYEDHSVIVFKKKEQQASNSNSVMVSQLPDVKSRQLLQDSEIPALQKSDLAITTAIQQARVAKKMSQKDLAAALAIKANEINLIESGKKPVDNKMISRISKVLSVELPRNKTTRNLQLNKASF